MRNLILLLLALFILTSCKSNSRIAEKKSASEEAPLAQATAPAAVVVDKKFVFDQSDREALETCGAEQSRSTLLKNLRKNLTNPFELVFSGVRLSREDNLSIENYFNKSIQPEYLNKQILEYVLQPWSKQKIENQSYWFFSKDNQKAIEYRLITRQKLDQVVNNPKDFEQLKYHLLIKQYDMSKNEVTKVTHKGGITGYLTQAAHGASTQYSVSFDVSTSHWFKVTSERIAECMEKSGVAAEGSSRDSIQAYITLTLFEQLSSKTPNASGVQIASSEN